MRPKSHPWQARNKTCRGDHTVDVDLDFGEVTPLVVVVGNDGRIAHVKEVQHDGGPSGGRGGGHFGRGLLCRRGFGYCGKLCLGGHDFFVVVFGCIGIFFVGCIVVIDVFFRCVVVAFAYC